MARTVFYSWQSDLPNSTNRGLIRGALDQALKALTAEVVEPERDEQRELLVDQDTQGVPGSPPIADTILTKIRECVVFVADVSFVTSGGTQGARMHPNPNVLVEYGYAVGVKGDEKIILVFNETLGEVRDLPFDLRHKRVVRYRAPEGDTPEAQAARRDARSSLGNLLAREIGNVLATASDESEALNANAFQKAKAEYVQSCFVGPAELLGVDSRDWASGDCPTNLQMAPLPHLFLRVIPTKQQRALPNAEALELVRRSHLMPLGPSEVREVSYGRNGYGAFAFQEPRKFLPGDVRATTMCITQLFRTREIWGVDALSLAHRTESGQLFFAPGSVEVELRDFLKSYLSLMRGHLAVRGALEIIAGMSGIQDFRLAVGPRDLRGPIFEKELVSSATVERDEDAPAVIDDLVHKYRDAAGM